MNQKKAKMLRRFTALKEHNVAAYRSRKAMWNKMPQSRREVVSLHIQRSVCSADPQELRAAMNCME